MTLLLALAACDIPKTEPDTVAEAGEPTFGYSGAAGPERWGELDEDWAACGEGTAQSPVDIVTADLASVDYAELDLVLGTTALRAYNSGHYIRYNVDSGSTFTTGAGVHDLEQFHFHGLSEHTVDGAHTAAEAHLVFTLRTDRTRYAVIGFWLDDEVGLDSDAFGETGELLFHDALALPESEEPTELGAAADLDAVFGVGDSFVTYEGSLTTPPCSETVTFFLMRTPMRLPVEDIDAFHAVYDFNYRPVQPLNGRVVSYASLPPR